VASRPVVKWAGGKSRLLDRLSTRLPPGRFRTYAEPFVGGGAMFFALAAERRFDRALLADKNADLVALYLAIQSDVKALIDRLRAYSDEHLGKGADARREHFYEVRSANTARMSTLERGARLLFLNKTCFNGLWRVNASGKFNVPYGRNDKPRILDVPVLEQAHAALQRATVRVADFAEITAELVEGDFAYFDPPYVPLSRTANFTAYATDPFGPAEQERLAQELVRLKASRVNAMLSNAATLESRALYERQGFHVGSIQAARQINSDASKRGNVEELVVTTYRVREDAHAPSSPRTSAETTTPSTTASSATAKAPNAPKAKATARAPKAKGKAPAAKASRKPAGPVPRAATRRRGDA
jgi:DNA adenine methylase